MLDISDYFLRREVIHSQVLQRVHIDLELKSTLLVILAFEQVVHIDGFDVFSQNVKIPVGTGNFMDLCLLMALINYFCVDLMLDKVHDCDLVSGHFLNHDVEVLPISILLVKDEGSSERTQLRLMLELTCDLADHFWVIPAMNALSDVGLVGGVLEKVHQLLPGSLLEEVGMEENDILRFYCGVDH